MQCLLESITQGERVPRAWKAWTPWVEFELIQVDLKIALSILTIISVCISIGFPLVWEQCPPFPYLGEKQVCMWDGVSVELRAGSPLQGPGGRPELGVSRKLEAQILGGKLGGWASSRGATVHMWPLSEGWGPLLDSEVCLLGQGEWGGGIYSPQFPLHVWASAEPLLSSCEQRNARSFISCEQGSKLHLPALTSGSEPGPLSAGSSFILLSSALCSIYSDCRITVLQVHFFFGMCPVSQESCCFLIHKHFFLLQC